MTERVAWQHQIKALEFSMGKQNVGLFFEVGTGKTFTALLIARSKMRVHNTALRTLVLCPPIVIRTWQKEVGGLFNFEKKKVVGISGHWTKRQAAFKANPLVAITNYETLLKPEVFAAIKAWWPQIIIFDESHRCKNPTAKRTKKAVELSDCTKYRMILTGTPVLNSPMDLFSQFLILDGGETFGRNFFLFRGHYFYDRNAGMPPQKHFPDWRVRAGALEEITNKISAKSIHVKKEECLDLPPLVKTTIYVDMSPEQAKAYKEMARDFITYTKLGTCVAQLALTKALRLMQIVSGFIAIEGVEGNARQEVSFKNPRSEALAELLSELAPLGKTLVWASFRNNYAQIRAVCEKLALPYVEIHGDIPNAKKMENVDTFNNDPKVRVCIGHPGSGGIGVTLTASKFSIYYSRTFSLEHDIQSESRNHRAGSEIHDKITRYDLVCCNSIDELVLKRLASKQAISESLIKNLALDLEKTL